MVLKQWICGVVRGHEDMLHVENGRLSLTCSCGFESVGIQTGPEPYDDDKDVLTRRRSLRVIRPAASYRVIG